MKRLLLLGGLRYLVPVIQKAKELGHYVITCDYLPNNIAHKFSDEYHNVSITDKEAVLELAKSLKVDGIMSFAVDPGVTTGAYVCEKLGLPCSGPYESVQILQNKGLFREFLKKNGFNVPKSRSFKKIEEAVLYIDSFELPVIVKPVDSAGSKGVSKVVSIEEFEGAIRNALSFSPTETFIVEDFLESKTYSSDSDCFSINGEFKFISFSSQRFDENSPNPYTPSAYSWPSSISAENQEELKSELQRLISLLQLGSSIYNIEVREAINNKAYIMEVSPRGGGNRLSEMLEYATGVDLISCAIQAALGEPINSILQSDYDGNWAEIILYSNRAGVFEELKVNESIENNIEEIDLWIKKGETVNAFTGAHEAIGTLVLRFEDQSELESVLSDYSSYIKVVVR